MKHAPDRRRSEGADWDPLDPAPRDPSYVLLLGIVGALVLASYGWTCIQTRSAAWVGGTDADLALGGGIEMHCHGPSAVAFGVMCIAAASFLHFHFFWSWRERFFGYAQVGKLLSLIVAVGGLSYFALRELFTFW